MRHFILTCFVLLFIGQYVNGQSTLLFNYTVTHVTDANDASISVSPYNGSNNYSFEWFDASMNSIGTDPYLNGISQGVYYLKLEDNLDPNSIINTYFWVGKYDVETTLSIQPDSAYGIDACVRHLGNFPYIDTTNYGDYVNMLVLSGTHSGKANVARQLIKFNYNGLNRADISNSTLSVYGWHHRNQPGNNSGIRNQLFVKRVKNSLNWNESKVTWNNSNMWNLSAIVSNENQAEIAFVGGTYSAPINEQYTRTANITNLSKEHAKNIKVNNGYLLGLLDENIYRSQYFYSSDYTVPLKRPKLSITFTVPNHSYTQVKDKLDGSYVLVNHGNMNINISYQEDYEDSDKLLSYKVFDMKRNLVFSNIDRPVSVKYGENRLVINGKNYLEPCGKYYVLEITNEKNEKKYLRLKTSTFSDPSYCNYQTNTGGQNQ